MKIFGKLFLEVLYFLAIAVAICWMIDGRVDRRVTVLEKKIEDGEAARMSASKSLDRPLEDLWSEIFVLRDRLRTMETQQKYARPPEVEALHDREEADVHTSIPQNELNAEAIRALLRGPNGVPDVGDEEPDEETETQ